MAYRTASPGNFPTRKRKKNVPRRAIWLLCLSLATVAYGAPAAGQGAAPQPDSLLPGTIAGRVVDQSQAPVGGARVKLSREGSPQGQESVSNDDGLFSFSNIGAGPFQLEVTRQGFRAHTTSGVLRSGETFNLPQIVLAVAAEATEVVVTPTKVEVAEDQIKEQEKQRVLGVIPNFYVTYVRDAAPLSPKQKFELAWKSTVDPVNFAITGVIAGVQQAQNEFSGYGQGTDGYARRYGAAFGTSVASTFIGGAVLPSVFKQDPRYFYKGTGSGRSRVLYALANAVICKGDNGHWQANYSSILGSLAAGGIANLYYPSQDRHDFALTVETALIGIGANAATNLLQEFVIRRFTPASGNPDPARPAPKVQNLISKLFPKPLHEGD